MGKRKFTLAQRLDIRNKAIALINEVPSASLGKLARDTHQTDSLSTLNSKKSFLWRAIKLEDKRVKVKCTWKRDNTKKSVIQS